MTPSWFFLSTLNYDARSNTHQIYLTIEIQRMWNVKTKVIPVIIGATGTVSTYQENMNSRN